jgi:Bacterial extracellular solute-binding proteins, family 5 Middle
LPARRGPLVVALVLVGACAHPSGAPLAPAGAATACLLVPSADAGARPPVVTVALTDSVDPTHAPVPRNDAERLVFRQLYETLVRFDCEGHALPSLAESWTSTDGGRRWSFTLRGDAQFWDGAPVTARDIVVGKGGAGYTLTPIDARTVGVWLAKGSDDVPAFLADPALAVTKPAPGGDWPIGTARYWVTGATATEQEIRAHSPAGDTLVFRQASAKDARDLLDAGVDLLITRDRSIADYAATQSAFSVVDLPWDRVYVLASAEAPTTRLDGLEQAVRGESRRPQGGGFWWENLRACGPAPAAAPQPSTTRRIVYVRGDAAGRDLAGRIAALGGGTAAGLGPAEFARSLAGGSGAGYVVALPRTVPEACRAARDLLPPWPASVAPLVETRARAVVRRAVPRWAVDGDGTLRVLPQ